MPLPTYRAAELEAIIREVREYVRSTRDRLYPTAQPLSPDQKRVFGRYLTAPALEKVRTVEPAGSPPLSNPEFVYRARTRGFEHMPDFTHLNEITLGDLIVFQQPPTARTLFHGLVHAAQYGIVGMDEYVELYLRAFTRTGLHVTVPFEVQAYEMDRRFAESPEAPFSVEEEIRSWLRTGRYQPPARP